MKITLTQNDKYVKPNSPNHRTRKIKQYIKRNSCLQLYLSDSVDIKLVKFKLGLKRKCWQYKYTSCIY